MKTSDYEAEVMRQLSEPNYYEPQTLRPESLPKTTAPDPPTRLVQAPLSNQKRISISTPP